MQFIRALILILAPLILANTAYSQPGETENGNPTFIESIQEFMSPYAGFDERLQEIGLTGNILKLRFHSAHDCPTNTLKAIERIMLFEKHFDIRKAYVIYLPYFSKTKQLKYHLALYYEGFVFDSGSPENEYRGNGEDYLKAYSLRDFFTAADGNIENQKVVLMPAEHYKWDMQFTGGEPPKIMKRLGDFYSTTKIPKGMFVFMTKEFVQISETSRLPAAPSLCGRLF
jgi:hypothetical protein